MGVGGSLFEIVAAINVELALFAAIGFLIGGIDDLLIDLFWFGSRLRRSRLDLDHPLEEAGPPDECPLAIFVPAWDEAAVIGAMLAETLRRFSDRDYRLYVGCYPNDPATLAVIEPIAASDSRLCIATCESAGPTTKADCLNAIWRTMRADEAADAMTFRAIILHDAEDVVHPAELRLFRRFIGDHALIQLPVRPMIDRASPWMAGHYCDEFAEAHGKNLVVRQMLGAGLPSAGVGCAISRAMLGAIADERGGAPFDEASLTEDYELGLR
ncbi:MAG: glycosyltransferase, partial [Sphingomonadaceae bacterium]|nr:glycosyltransferase [Sphingomonadaceae bacterium]